MKTMIIKRVFLGIVVLAAFSAAVMLLWNFLIPGIFGWGTLSFWQALGLFILARILFGGFGGHRMMMGKMHGKGKNHIHEKWMKMTPEEREAFINKRREYMHWGSFGGRDCRHGGFGPKNGAEAEGDTKGKE